MAKRRADPRRIAAFNVLKRVYADGAYAHLELGHAVRHVDAQDAAFITELVAGTCRMQGSYDVVIEAAGGRAPERLQVSVACILRLACQQHFAMETPPHAVVTTSVDLAGIVVGERVTGLVNAIVRKIVARDWDEWMAQLAAPGRPGVALRHGHPRWIAQALADALGDDDLVAALHANNVPPVPTLACRPGLAIPSELDGEPARYSPWGAYRRGDPSDVAAIREGRAGVQDEGSQLVVLAATRAAPAEGAWADICAGPGGKSALLAGLAPHGLVSFEKSVHRAGLVAQALRAYPRQQVVIADATTPAWRPESFGLVVADVPCSGLGALRRRPEARWRKSESDLEALVALQRKIVAQAIDAAAPGGVVAYITCSPHPRETVEVVAGAELIEAPTLLPEVPRCASRLDARCIQLWPHIHGTDAMFCALIRKRPDR